MGRISNQPDKRRITAYHEAGHAIACWFLEHIVVRVSIIPRGNTQGHTLYICKKRYSRKRLFDRICICLGGSVSEKIFFGKITPIGWKDLARAEEIAYKLIRMDEKVDHLSFFDSAQPENVIINKQVNYLVSWSFHRTLELLQEHREDVKKVAASLLVNEIIFRDEMIQLFGHRPFREKSTYEIFVEGTGSFREDTALHKNPLKNFNTSKHGINPFTLRQALQKLKHDRNQSLRQKNFKISKYGNGIDPFALRQDLQKLEQDGNQSLCSMHPHRESVMAQQKRIHRDYSFFVIFILVQILLHCLL